MIRAYFRVTTCLLIATTASFAHTPEMQQLTTTAPKEHELECCTKQVETAILRLLEQGDLACSALEKERFLLKLKEIEARAQEMTLTQRNYERARAIAEFIHLRMVVTPEMTLDRTHPGVVAQDTRTLIKRIEHHLETRNLGRVRTALRTIADTVEENIPFYLLIGTPIACYGAWWLGTELLQKATNARLTTAEGAADNAKKEPANTAHCGAWNFAQNTVQGVFILTVANEMEKYLKDASVMPVIQRSTDWVKGCIAWTLARPFRNSNPASSSKAKLAEIVLTPLARKTADLIAVAQTYREESVKMGAATPYSKYVFIRGDSGLASDYADGLASAINVSLKAANKKGKYMVAKIHVSKLLEEGAFRKEMEKIKAYNSACVILISDIDWLATTDEVTRARVSAELFNGIKSHMKPLQQYVFLSHATDATAVDATLYSPALGTVQCAFNLAEDAALAEACVQRLERLFNLTVRNADLRNQLIEYAMAESYSALKNLFERFYNGALPHIGAYTFDDAGLRAELAHTLQNA